MSTLEELLPDGSLVIGYSVQIKYLNDKGEVELRISSGGNLPQWEIIGMLISHCDDLRESLREGSE